MADVREQYDALEVVPLETYGTYKEYVPDLSVSNEQPYLARTYNKHRRKIIVIVIIAVLITIAAILGGVLGTQLHHDSSHLSSTPGATNSPPPGSNSMASRVNVLVNSRLAASNCTDPQGVNHRTVFFQDPWNNIVARQWNATNSTWSTRNISDEVSKSLGSLGLKFALGSPFASTATDYWDTTLWYLDNNYQVQAIYWTFEDSALVFHQDVSDARLLAGAGSSLTAAWQRPALDNAGNGSWGVAYQPSNGDVVVANSSNWRLPNTAVDSSDVAINSSIALLPDLEDGRLSRLTLMWQSNSVAMKRSSYENWDHGLDAIVFSGLPPLSSGLQFAMTAFKAWTNVLFIALTPNGNLASNWWDGSKFNSITHTQLALGPVVSFSAIAMTNDAMFYGISGDQILEYSIDQSNPATFNYVGAVFG